MAHKPFQLLYLIFLFFLLFSTISHAKRHTPKKKSSPFDFIKKLKGCHKGNHTKDIHQLKAYLKQFGYLKYPNETHANNDDFDGTLESAIKTYQKNFHIKPTGRIDAKTISKMITPRCGVPDIINGTNHMQPRNKRHEPSSSHIHKVSHFSFFSGNPRWPAWKTRLTYRFLPDFPTNGIAPVARAFQKWDVATHFTFAQTNLFADIVIGFEWGDHGDGDPFDGPGGTIAHAFAPTIGRFHLDGDEPFSVTPAADSFHLETVAVHEIGHLLGLGHSSFESAIMYPQLDYGQVKNLQADDIQGIRALYNR